MKVEKASQRSGKLFCLFDYKNRDVFFNQARVVVVEERELESDSEN